MSVMSPPHSIRRRRSGPLASKSADSHLEGQASKLAKDARRRRVELRRIRTFSQAMSALDSSSSANVDKLLAEMQEEATEGASADSLGAGRRRSSSYGKISVIGRRREMDDVVAVQLDFLRRAAGETYDFFGVFDWHEGRRVARACSQLLHRILAKIVDEQSEKEIIDWEEVMLEGFDEMEAKINNLNGAPIAGSSTVVAVVGDSQVVVGTKCDGSKAVLCSGGVAVRLSDDEKMKNHREEEEEDEEEEEVVQVKVVTRRHADEFLILGSDGFWDVVSDEMACQIASAAAYTDGVEAAAALMAEFAVAHGSKDNITVVLVDLGGASATTSAAATT